MLSPHQNDTVSCWRNLEKSRPTAVSFRSPVSCLLAYPLAILSPVEIVVRATFPRCWFAINEDGPGGGLVLVALNRIESPLSVVCFAFSREVDAMALGIRVPLRSLSGQESMLEFRLQLTTLDTRMDTIERQNS